MKLISIGTEHDGDDDSVKAHVIEVMGHGVWQKLTKSLGGRVVRIPLRLTTLHRDHDLVLALGANDARIFVEQFSGEKIYIHNHWRGALHRYRRAISEGFDNTSIASRFGITDRAVRLFLSRAGIQNPNRKPRHVRTGPIWAPDNPEFLRRARAYLKYLKGEIPSRTAAARRLGMDPAAFRSFVKNYQSQLDEYAAASGHASVSNGGLTRLAGQPRLSGDAATENRPSGL